MDTDRVVCQLCALWFCLLCITGHLCMGCRDEEREALLSIKQNVRADPFLQFSNWKGSNCCSWMGVGCDNTTGHVIKLNPIVFFVSDNFWALSWSALKYLQHLDLSFTYSNRTSLPQSIGSLTHLRYLSLAGCGFVGAIPSNFGNLTNLRYLDLSYNFNHLSLSSCGFVGAIPSNFGNLTNLLYLDLSGSGGSLRSDSLQWLSHLSNLQYLDLSNVNLTSAMDWPLVLHKLPALSVLQLSWCGLYTFPAASSLPKTNFSSITTLALDHNYFPDASPLDWLLVNLTSTLVHLSLADCHLRGSIPRDLGNFPPPKQQTLDLPFNNSSMHSAVTGSNTYRLKELDLSGGQLTGSIPDWISQMKSLKRINLRYNLLNGSIPASLGQLQELVSLDLSSNLLQGVVSDVHLSNFTKLKLLDLHSNSLIFNMSSTWLPPFQLTEVYLGSCLVGPRFPPWLRMQEKLSSIDISHAGISDVVPDWFWNISQTAFHIDISHNQIRGEVSKSLKFLTAEYIDLSSNLFTGQLPFLNSSLSKVYLSDNLLSGDLQPILNGPVGNLKIVLLSRNHLTGKIPLSICKWKYVQVLDLSYNDLTGVIPDCPSYASYDMRAVNFASNNLFGSIPKWISNLSSLMLLSLSRNSFHGEIPSFRNCSMLILLDLGENKFTGSIPPSVGESLPMLTILRLHSNMLTGNIPSQLSNLSSLQILDLSQNNLTGRIPSSFSNFTAMMRPNKGHESHTYIYNGGGMTYDNSDSYIDDVTDLDHLDGFLQSLNVVMKGGNLEYTTTLRLVVLLDLSYNELSGEIPVELMDLAELLSLNLSGNQLTGRIPKKIGNMVSLETLDLSRNMLSGEIPWSLTSLYSLSSLDLSHNNLSGAIPSGWQLQTLTNLSIYEGNPGLCGFPLPKKCSEGGKSPELGESEDNSDDHDMFEWYLSIGLGFLVGLWCVYGIFLFKRSWRIAYFNSLMIWQTRSMWVWGPFLSKMVLLRAQ